MYNRIKSNIIDNSLMIMGIIICLIQFFQNRSLWLDEAFLANNIINRNFWNLFEPLDHGQVAPIGFLLFTKLFSLIIPNSELGLRVFPLFLFLFSVALIYKVAKLLFRNKIVITFCLSLFIFNNPLIYYSSELKQYMSDVFVILLLLYNTIKYSLSISSHYLRFILIGAFCIFMSNITPIVLLSCGIYLFFANFHALMKGFSIRNVMIIIFSAWLVTFVFYYFFFIHNHPTKDFMVQYWSNAIAFPPNDIMSEGFWIFLITKVAMVFTKLLNFGKIGFLLVLLYFIGFSKLVLHKKYGFIILFVLPILFHFILSWLKLYPFETRLVLYSSVLYIFIISLGLEILLNSKYLRIFDNSIVNAMIPFMFLWYFIYSSPFPFKNEEIKELFSYLDRNNDKNYHVYVHHGSAAAFNYYQSINIYNHPNHIIFGKSSRDNKFKYIEEIVQLNKPLWLLFSHIKNDEDQYVIQKLDSIGFRTRKSFEIKQVSLFKEVKGASLYLIED